MKIQTDQLPTLIVGAVAIVWLIIIGIAVIAINQPPTNQPCEEINEH